MHAMKTNTYSKLQPDSTVNQSAQQRRMHAICLALHSLQTQRLRCAALFAQSMPSMTQSNAALEELRSLYTRGDFEHVVTRTEQLLKRRRSEGDELRVCIEAVRAAALIQSARSSEALPILQSISSKLSATVTENNLTTDISHTQHLHSFLQYALPYIAWATSQGVGEAVQAASSLPGENPRKLEAQLLYRQGRYAEASSIYRMLLHKKMAVLEEKRRVPPPKTSIWRMAYPATSANTPVTSAEIESVTRDVMELATNLMATYVLSGEFNEALNVKNSLKTSYELEYNATCACIAMSDFDAAHASLRNADTLLRQLREETRVEEDVEGGGGGGGGGYEEMDDINDEEMAPVRVQRAYLQQMCGQVMEAKTSYEQIVTQRAADAASLAVAANNLTVALGQLAFDKQVQQLESRRALVHAAGSETEGATEGTGAAALASAKKLEKERHDALADALKKMRATSGARVETRLTYQQKRAMSRNRAILLAQMGRFEGCKAELDRLKVAFPNDRVNALIEAALIANKIGFEQAQTLLRDVRDDDHDDDVLLSAARVQLAEDHGERARAANLLVQLFKHRPAAVATAACILEEIGNVDEAVQLLKNVSPENANAKKHANKALAQVYLRQSMYKEAAELLEKVLEENGNDEIALAQLVVATSYFDTQKAQSIVTRLPAATGISQSASDVPDAAQLELLPPPRRRTRAPQALVNGDGADGDGHGVVQKKKSVKKKKKKRLPKNYDPNAPPPDPERWLPKTLRTGYKKRKGRRNENQFKGSQGADAAAADAAAIKNAERSAARIAAAAAETAGASAASSRPKGAKKKKKTRR